MNGRDNNFDSSYQNQSYSSFGNNQTIAVPPESEEKQFDQNSTFIDRLGTDNEFTNPSEKSFYELLISPESKKIKLERAKRIYPKFEDLAANSPLDALVLAGIHFPNDFKRYDIYNAASISNYRAQYPGLVGIFGIIAFMGVKSRLYKKAVWGLTFKSCLYCSFVKYFFFPMTLLKIGAVRAESITDVDVKRLTARYPLQNPAYAEFYNNAQL